MTAPTRGILWITVGCLTALVGASVLGASAWTLVVIAAVFLSAAIAVTRTPQTPAAPVNAADRLAPADLPAPVTPNPADTAVRALEQPIVVTDGTGRVTLANAAAAEFLGRPVESVVARGLDEVFSHADVLAAHDAAVRGVTHRAQVRVAADAGPARVFEVQAFPAGAPQRGAVITLRDITELATAVQLRTDFVANASHELRTPLASIRGALDTLGEHGGDPAASARFLPMIAANVERLEDLTRDLVDLSRLESPEAPLEITTVSVPDLIDELRAVFEPVCRERRLEITPDLEPGARTVETDRRTLTLIFKNLIENSTKFSYEGTTIVVKGRLEHATGPGAGGSEAGTVRFEFTDRGLGIPLSQQARIFERFYQGDASRSGHARRRGTGLGLAIVRHAVRTLGGTVRVESVWKEGTTMIVELPRKASGRDRSRPA